ncbi:MAG: AAA family ATPase [Lachnospiraceae bacterium]|nr:AAA family ATPase [Lachnospiraceae bacterium]
MRRKIWDEIDHFFENSQRQALLITGARQVGKTYIIREYAKRKFEYFIEINFLENKEVGRAFDSAATAEDFLLRISAMTNVPMIKGKTLIFFDEVQECPEIVTMIKFLVDEGSYSYIMSGSLLGVELKDIKSVPVGYLKIVEMFPMDFFEFCRANKVSDEIFDLLQTAFAERKQIDPFIHEKIMSLFRLYLVIGGMPAAVNAYLKTKNIQNVVEVQRGIIALYKKDIAKYDPENKLYLENIFDLIPSELNSKNKRFILKKLNENFKFSRYENSFIWLKEAGVALPVYCVDEPVIPLVLSRSTNLFKLFLADVGLLSSMYMNGIQLKVLNGEIDINFGSVWENAVAQELQAHGFDLYYFNSKKQGELDFVIEQMGKILPIEVKSGKNYTRHHALNTVLSNEIYKIPEGLVLCSENIRVENNVFYCPVYLTGMLKKEENLDYHYEIDLTGLV